MKAIKTLFNSIIAVGFIGLLSSCGSEVTDSSSNISSLVVSESTTLSESSSNSIESSTEGFIATFILDSHASVTVYSTQECINGEELASAYAKDSETGEIITDGDGQINFLVNIDLGYELANIIATPSANYSNLKGPDETLVDNTYRITKMIGDVDITITTAVEGTEVEVEGFAGTFVCDNNATVTIFDTQDYTTTGFINTIAYAKDSETGEILIDGTGQINFIVNVSDGYVITSIGVTPSTNYKNLKGPDETLTTNAYRITKITGNITITITTSLA